MLIYFRNFLRSENGAVTVDWVLLTSAVVALGWLMYFYLHEPIQGLAEKSGTAIANVQVDPISFK